MSGSRHIASDHRRFRQLKLNQRREERSREEAVPSDCDTGEGAKPTL